MSASVGTGLAVSDESLAAGTVALAPGGAIEAVAPSIRPPPPQIATTANRFNGGAVVAVAAVTADELSADSSDSVIVRGSGSGVGVTSMRPPVRPTAPRSIASVDVSRSVAARAAAPPVGGADSIAGTSAAAPSVRPPLQSMTPRPAVRPSKSAAALDVSAANVGIAPVRAESSDGGAVVAASSTGEFPMQAMAPPAAPRTMMLVTPSGVGSTSVVVDGSGGQSDNARNGTDGVVASPAQEGNTRVATTVVQPESFARVAADDDSTSSEHGVMAGVEARAGSHALDAASGPAVRPGITKEIGAHAAPLPRASDGVSSGSDASHESVQRGNAPGGGGRMSTGEAPPTARVATTLLAPEVVEGPPSQNPVGHDLSAPGVARTDNTTSSSSARHVQNGAESAGGPSSVASRGAMFGGRVQPSVARAHGAGPGPSVASVGAKAAAFGGHAGAASAPTSGVAVGRWGKGGATAAPVVPVSGVAMLAASEAHVGDNTQASGGVDNPSASAPAAPAAVQEVPIVDAATLGRAAETVLAPMPVPAARRVVEPPPPAVSWQFDQDVSAVGVPPDLNEGNWVIFQQRCCMHMVTRYFAGCSAVYRLRSRGCGIIEAGAGSCVCSRKWSRRRAGLIDRGMGLMILFVGS